MVGRSISPRFVAVALVLWGLFASVLSVSIGGQPEMESHGGHSPHERRAGVKDHLRADGHEHNVDFDHEAVLGSRRDAAEFDQLSPAESKRRLAALCRSRMDKNGDGAVDRDELTDWIEKSLKQLDAEEVEEKFDEADANHDGLVSWEEYKSDTFGSDELDADDQKLLVEDRLYFEAADIGAKGHLTKTEFAAFQNPEGFAHMYDAVYHNSMKEKDVNQDGFIDLNEFTGEYAGKDNEWLEFERERFQKDFDKNGDGKLDKEEMRNWLVPDARETAADESQHLFESADKDKDGVISCDEMVDSHELFVGSEATNYGELLENFKHEEL